MTRNRTLVVRRTGWGKSLVYFVCTKLLRDQKRGVTMVVSPLPVLMENGYVKKRMSKGEANIENPIPSRIYWISFRSNSPCPLTQKCQEKMFT